MAKVIINSYSEFEKLIGKEIGVSEYHRVTQAGENSEGPEIDNKIIIAEASPTFGN